MRPSAPASMYSSALSRASSKPASAMRLSSRAMTMKSSPITTSLPALIFWAKTNGSSSSWLAEPSRLFLLGNTLSSIITAETPNRSRFLTMYSNWEASPPVSPSTIMGLVVTLSISSMVRARESLPTMEASGNPLVAESVRLLSHIPSYSTTRPFIWTRAFSTTNPLRPLWASRIRANPFREMHSRKPLSRSQGLILFSILIRTSSCVH